MFAEFLQSDLRNRGLEVIGESDIFAILGFERTRAVLSCAESTCLSEIGGALGVNDLVHGTIGKMGEYLAISIKRTDRAKARVLGQVAIKIKVSFSIS